MSQRRKSAPSTTLNVVVDDTFDGDLTEFDLSKCSIPTYWCGSGDELPPEKDGRRYVRKGTPTECLRIGVGVGKYTVLRERLPPTSLQQIKYVGDKYEEKFRRYNISSLSHLVNYAQTHSPTDLQKLLRAVYTKSSKVVDLRAYNSTLSYLYQRGVLRLPQCVYIDDRK